MPQTVSVEDVLGAVDAWFEDTIRKGPIARDVDAYNQAFAARATLKERLTALLAPATPPKTTAPTPPTDTPQAAEPAANQE